ncbi:ATP-dependent Clp protease, protease subunit [Alkalithermobacter thermoalcaliphilus JW-YL-7 = DSM 7308]|uniref:ATP-dependent Clp protease proteolytic subunit n=1 Tax=Alkalithermobacter thermoalcaliphilus JW-YL-7 = DSM 7308 TaxID=1121328 RepID=A0A150FS70_CLOPD|nr:ClpP/TepA [[Clostridium] paradoxum JW-YL-7 = DSM 7308]SHL13521.1 ATP-dependent Clp protease, protease subunit [[Clostridium] paradoxum JW-YL-7 = DSM 7308]
MKNFWNLNKVQNNEGELFIYGPISDESWWGDEVIPKQFKDELDSLGEIDVLNIYINSPGGDVFAGQTIYSILKRHKSKKVVHVDGLAASIASIIAMAGDTVIMPQNAMMMIHNPWTVAMGNANDFRKLADDLDKIRESLIAAYQGKSNLDREKLIELMNAETWLTAEEALNYGLIDEVEEKKEIAASIDKNFTKMYKNIPRNLIKEEKTEQKQDLAIVDKENLKNELSKSILFLETRRNEK